MAQAEAEQQPTPKPGEGRRGEGVVVVLQSNTERALTIGNINEVAEQLLGYAPGELKGRKLETILAPRTAEFLAEEIEYIDEAPDLGDVLARHREIRLRHRAGNEITVRCNTTRIMAIGLSSCFQIVIPNERELLAKQKIRDFVTLNLQGRAQLDPSTGLPNHETAEQFLPLLKNYLAESSVQAVFAVLRLDRHKKSITRYGKEPCVELLKHAANCCRSTFRTEDMVFALSDHTLGIVLFDISRDSARVVLNRLRWNIRAHRIVFGGKSDFSVTTSVSFDMLDAERGDGVLERCEIAVATLDEEERNSLVELGV